MNAHEYNLRDLDRGRITAEHVTAMTRLVQEKLGLPVDGMCGPDTRSALFGPDGAPDGHEEDVRDLLRPLWRLMGAVRPTLAAAEPLTIDEEGWLHGRGVKRVPAHPSWYYAERPLATETPAAIVVHTTETKWGTARAMARRRVKARKPNMRSASWHITLGHDGVIWQMVPLLRGAWHAGSPTARPVPGLGIRANMCAPGIEVEGYGEEFPEKQTVAAYRVWRAIVRRYEIPRARAMITHKQIDPVRRSDPGDIWMERYAPWVLEYAFAAEARNAVG